MDPKKKAPPAKAPAKGAKVDEAAAVPAAPPPDAPGWDTLSALLSGLKERARAYDEWRAGVKVYNTAAAAPAQEVAPKPSEDSDPMAEVEVVEAGPAGIKASSSMAYYESLLAGVEPERLNVPVLMHAMLEQVCGTKGTLGFSLPLPLRSLSLSLSPPWDLPSCVSLTILIVKALCCLCFRWHGASAARTSLPRASRPQLRPGRWTPSQGPMPSSGTQQTRAASLPQGSMGLTATTAGVHTPLCRRWVGVTRSINSARSDVVAHSDCPVSCVASLPLADRPQPDNTWCPCFCCRAMTSELLQLASPPARSDRCHAWQEVSPATVLPLAVHRPRPRLWMGLVTVQALSRGRMPTQAGPPCSSQAPGPWMWMPLNLTCWG